MVRTVFESVRGCVGFAEQMEPAPPGRRGLRFSILDSRRGTHMLAFVPLRAAKTSGSPSPWSSNEPRSPPGTHLSPLTHSRRKSPFAYLIISRATCLLPSFHTRLSSLRSSSRDFRISRRLFESFLRVVRKVNQCSYVFPMAIDDARFHRVFCKSIPPHDQRGNARNDILTGNETFFSPRFEPFTSTSQPRLRGILFTH